MPNRQGYAWNRGATISKPLREANIYDAVISGRDDVCVTTSVVSLAAFFFLVLCVWSMMMHCIRTLSQHTRRRAGVLENDDRI